VYRTSIFNVNTCVGKSFIFHSSICCVCARARAHVYYYYYYRLREVHSSHAQPRNTIDYHTLHSNGYRNRRTKINDRKKPKINSSKSNRINNIRVNGRKTLAAGAVDVGSGESLDQRFQSFNHQLEFENNDKSVRKTIRRRR